MDFRRLFSRAGVTLIELVIVLAIMSLAISTVFSMFFFGNRTYSGGTEQYDIQSSIRLASDIIADKTRYVTYMELLSPGFTMNDNFNYIFVSDDNRSIKLKEGSNAPVDITNSSISNAKYSILFSKGENIGAAAISYSNTFIPAVISTDSVLKYEINALETHSNKNYNVNSELIILNLNSQMPYVSLLDAPLSNKDEGIVPIGTQITLTTPLVAGGTIYYTIDGTVPSSLSAVYTGPITIYTSTIIKAITVKDGISSMVVAYEYTIVNDPPTATEVVINGNKKVGNPLTVTYKYFDLENDIQGNSIIRWYRSIDKNINPSSSTLTLIKDSSLGNGGLTYITTNSDNNYYIYVEVKPVQKIDSKTGPSIWSNDFGKITQTGN